MTNASRFFIVLLFFSTFISNSVASSPVNNPAANTALSILFEPSDPKALEQSLSLLDQHWDEAYIPHILESLSVPRNFEAYLRVLEFLRLKTNKNFIGDIHKWYFWLWNRPANMAEGYDNFKATYYSVIDPHFSQYFEGRQSQTLIRLDEIRWGGVKQDGIPPLRNPKMITAKEANYLEDNHIVFGMAINGDARAYPKRILAWHEMFTDTIGGVDIAGVYCTLCGTVIPYKTRVNGYNYQLGTSGFLYRSNKLMYDKKTQSLWSTVKGEPVVGPLINKGIKLEHVGVVTTTWGEWKRRHPDTKVLSLNTGHYRDYAEGAAYKDYFADDRLMFHTPFKDKRLNNKQEVVALVFPAAPQDQLAIDTAFLNKNPLYKNKIGAQKFIIATDKSGANRVYDPRNINFTSYDQDKTLTDSTGNKWQLNEEFLIAPDGKKLEQLPYRRAFWFGWHAAYPETQLIK